MFTFVMLLSNYHVLTIMIGNIVFIPKYYKIRFYLLFRFLSTQPGYCTQVVYNKNN